ncbi:unnamed protein product, partial [Ectocarpus sp. 13 AM-2016]
SQVAPHRYVWNRFNLMFDVPLEQRFALPFVECRVGELRNDGCKKRVEVSSVLPCSGATGQTVSHTLRHTAHNRPEIHAETPVDVMRTTEHYDRWEHHSAPSLDRCRGQKLRGLPYMTQDNT